MDAWQNPVVDSITHYVPRASASDAWYLAQCKPREDRRAVENLLRQGFEAFAPLCQVERLRNRVWRLRIEALFPGYAFVRLNRIEHDWGKIRSTRGVRRLVRFGRFGECIPKVPDPVIERIRTMDGVALGSPRTGLEPGTRVRILEGPFADYEAIFERTDGEERVMLLLELMHREVHMLFDLAVVAPA